MQEQYRTVAREGVHETEINRSRFLCALAPAATEAGGAGLRRAHPQGAPRPPRHNCFAYVIGADAAVQKASDDGEPGGTAGVPMLQMLLRRDMRYVVAVVTRYYGGVKLGAGGLIRAYGGAVGEALDALGTVTRRRFRLATVTVDHQRAGKAGERPARHRPRGARRALRRRRSPSRSGCRTPTSTPSAPGWPTPPRARRAWRLGGEAYGDRLRRTLVHGAEST